MKIRRSIAALLACVTTSAMILAATLLSARADDPLDDHQFMALINTGSAKCFEPTRRLHERPAYPTAYLPPSRDR